MGLQNIWGPMLAWDEFLAGAGAGAYLVAVVALWFNGRSRHLVKPGVIAGPILVAIGALLLLIDLGTPLNAFRAFASPDTSILSVGIILITAFLILGAIHILLVLFSNPSDAIQKTLGTVNGILGLGVLVYPGLLLAQVKSIPFWNTPMLPLLFALSGVVTGIAVLVVIAGVVRMVRAGTDVGESILALNPIMLLLLGVEIVALFLQVFVETGTTVTEAISANYLISGPYAIPFWIGVVIIGLVVPILLAAWAVRGRARLSAATAVNVSALAAVCLLIGGVVLRYAILSAGTKVVLTLH